MENSKLMTPLFYDGFFNREGRRMRAILDREIINGSTTYRIWRGVGKPDMEYPRAENDKYILHVEINGYLLPLEMTDYRLVQRCGFEAMAKRLYGGEEERNHHFDSLRQSCTEAEIRAELRKEDELVEQYGAEPVCQAEYIQSFLEKKVNTYLESKESGGQTFPDFIGALVLDELAMCVQLSAVYKAKRQAENEARRARAAEEEKVFCEERNREAEQTVSDALQVIRNGGVLENITVTFYRSRYSSSSYSIVNYLMREYRVDVPLRTQGWINDRLCSAVIKDGRCGSLRYLRRKNERGSQKFFECMNALIRAVNARTQEQTNGGVV